MMNPIAACIQMDIKFGDPEYNFSHAEEKIAEACEKGEKPDFLLLPELWTTGYDLARLDETADQEGIQAQAFISRLSQKYGVNIIAGSIAKKSQDGITNTLYAVNASGETVHEYSKLHLFRLMDEHHYLTGGNENGLFEIDGLKSAGLICYDIRFPEWVRFHALKGAEVLFVAAEWPEPRLDHWRTLLLARAIENQCFVVACNRTGNDPKNAFAGHSMIIDPWGKVLAEGDSKEGIIQAELDLSKISEVRNKIPVFEDRLPEYYEK